MKKVLATLSIAVAAAIGSAFADTPDELLDYVATDGSAYIDTGIIGKAGTKANIGMMWNGTTSSSDNSFLGARNGSNGRFILCHTYQQKWNLAYSCSYRTGVATSPRAGQRHVL